MHILQATLHDPSLRLPRHPHTSPATHLAGPLLVYLAVSCTAIQPSPVQTQHVCLDRCHAYCHAKHSVADPADATERPGGNAQR
ncbi:hypothetical protein BCR37DRAFT_383395 [Protomyces lactucae-debilis]|uniref:Uncharacterized protein n=1 Tax=Protomyces lactucae-debilis TaxID=2754530 RepID=A0A1Y2EXJ2_PROLT|nr:uncharacterized protein BCR37DRAFT_383395 [Protomyces lactucae-debilis]ORY76313.1 hypothetical protein BCR37DRAFT_383395 [Protomyces lactucae-debilis]